MGEGRVGESKGRRKGGRQGRVAHAVDGALLASDALNPTRLRRLLEGHLKRREEGWVGGGFRVSGLGFGFRLLKRHLKRKGSGFRV